MSYSNGWEKGVRNSRQLQEVIYTVNDASVTSYEIGQSPNSSDDILRNIFVYINNKKTTNFTTGTIEGKKTVTVNDTLTVNDQIVIKFTSTEAFNKRLL